MTAALASTLSVVNVVTTSQLDQAVDLDVLADTLPTARYDPSYAPGLIYRVPDTQLTALVFRSGHLTCTGASSIEEATQGIHDLVAEFGDLGLDVPREPEVLVQNMVSTADLGSPLRLTAVAVGLGLEVVEYEPEQFPGLVYRLPETNVVSLLFGSGRVVFTGARNFDETQSALERVHGELTNLNLMD